MISSFKKLKLHTLHILALLTLALTLGSVGIGIFLQNNPYIYAVDSYFYYFFTHYGHHSIIDFAIKLFNYNYVNWAGPMPTYLYLEVLGALLFLVARKKSLLGYFIFTILLGSILAYIITWLDWRLVFRERPFLTLPSIVDQTGLNAWGALSSFPSGHARETALYSTIIANYIPKLKTLLIIFVIFIAYSRVYIGAHYPTDAIAGVLIGYLAAKTTLIIGREIQIILEKRKGVKHEQKPRS